MNNLKSERESEIQCNPKRIRLGLYQQKELQMRIKNCKYLSVVKLRSLDLRSS